MWTGIKVSLTFTILLNSCYENAIISTDKRTAANKTGEMLYTDLTAPQSMSK